MENVFQERKEKLKKFRENLELLSLKKEKSPTSVADIPDHIFSICSSCGNSLLTEELEENYFVCPVCGFHEKLKAKKRIALLFDEFKETNATYEIQNPTFDGYQEKLNAYKNATGLKDAVITGIGKINEIEVAAAVMDGFFMMGSMGSIVGEKLTQLIELATEKKLPLLICCASGGARMQEGIISLMQMAKTASAIAKFQQSKGLYISLLTYPTTGGVSASFASLADITIAEPKALIGFAGKRVIEKTIKEVLPAEFQSAEFLLEHGFIDMIVERNELKEKIHFLLKFHQC